MTQHPAGQPTPATNHPLRGIAEIRHFFRTNTTPVYFIGATPFNLLGLDRWVRNFEYITYYDAWDGAHPRVFSPKDKPPTDFSSGEEINNYLLRHPEVRAFMQRKPGRPKVAMVFFDEQTESICHELGYDLILPAAALRDHLDSKIVTTRLGNEAGAPSVPNILTCVDSWDALVAQCTAAGLGTDVVLQTPYGDSGKTTFFLSTEQDWHRHAADIVGHQQKIMKRINNRGVAVEAVLTRHGTIVGPFMSELIGYAELTPYRGGWCGNETYPEVLTGTRRDNARQLVRRLGDRLADEGYQGFFEVDVLVDLDSEEVYLGELNPRISGASSITNVTAGAYSDLPLFLFHLLEYMNIDYELDVDEINDRWEDLAAVDVWSQMVIKETSPGAELITKAPATGQWYLDDTGELRFRRAALDWHQLQNENECFFLRIYGEGDHRWKGADLGVLVTKGRLQRPRLADIVDAARSRLGPGASTARSVSDSDREGAVDDAAAETGSASLLRRLRRFRLRRPRPPRITEPDQITEPAGAPDLIARGESAVDPSSSGPRRPQPGAVDDRIDPAMLTSRARTFIEAIRDRYTGQPVNDPGPAGCAAPGLKGTR